MMRHNDNNDVSTMDYVVIIIFIIDNTTTTNNNNRFFLPSFPSSFFSYTTSSLYTHYKKMRVDPG